MNCPRCNAEVPDSATFCQNCGSSIRPTTTAFSYLPAGAPPWPTSTAQLPASIATLPRVSANGTDAIAAQDGATSARTAVASNAERPRRSAGSIFAVAGILILAVIVGSGLTFFSLYANGQLAAQTPVKPVTLPKATATSTVSPQGTSASTPTTDQLPTPTSFQKISKTGSTDLQVSLQFPSDWQEDAPQVTNGTTAIAFHPQQIPIFFVVARLSASDSASVTSADDLNQLQISSLQSAQGVSNVQSVTPVAAQRTIGGATWPEQDAIFDLSTSAGTVEYHATSIATQHNSVYYNIFFYAPSIVYNEALQKYFQPIFNSFQFTS
ncbi:MAG TPA: zinc ribbon domain-containing protein [Ktedonobacteraceae bacterium]|nr:zinc ribbon domain-containing protein [Ktedonobacteraceae bacterium]